MTVTNVTSTQSGFPTTATVSGDGPPAPPPADGYGNFGYDLNWGVSAGDRLQPGKTATFTITYAGVLTDAALMTLTVSNGGTLGANAGSLHFFGNTSGLTGYTGSGAGSTQNPAPEPSTILGASMACLMGLVYALRRGKVKTA